MPPMYKVLIVGLLLCIILPTSAAVAQGDILSVYYAGPDGGVRQALELDKTIELVTDQAQAQVFVLDGVINERVDPRAIHTRLEEGAGLILILGLDLHADQVSILLGEPVTLEKREDVLSLTPVRGSQDAALREIVWNSAPQVRERFTFMGSTLYPLVVGFEDQSLVLGAGKIGQGQVFVFTPLLYGANPQVQEWAYFNYLIYHLVQRAAGREPLSFADYPGSPVPHHLEQIFLFIVLAGMLVISGIAFWLVRSYSLRHPEALDVIVANKEAFSAREAGTDWEEIGFHRPLGGFFLTLFFGMVLFVPLIIYQNLILPVYILPSAQALGIWGRVTQFFTLIWTLFDMEPVWHSSNIFPSIGFMIHARV
jgi:hypothetical protein